MSLPQPSFQEQSGMADELSDHDEEIFEDAEDDLSMTKETNLQANIEQVKECLHLFLNNQISEAISILKPKKSKHVYHALGWSSIHLIHALMTYEPKDLEQAYDYLTEATQFCNQFRHKSSLTNNSVTKLVKRPNYNDYTEEQVHAELIHAELLLMWGLSTLSYDENILSLIKGGLRLRSSYVSYKECYDILEHRNWTNPELKMHFKSGVLLGLGVYSVVISLFPSGLRRLLGVVGFIGDAEYGCSLLDQGLKLQKALRAPLCSLMLLAFSTVLTFALGIGKVNVDQCKSIVDSLYKWHPKGTLVLYFMARVHHIQGNIQEAMCWLKKSMSADDDWKQFKFLCYWELQWCYGAMGQWRQQAHYVKLINSATEWSKAIPSYMYASSLFMCNDQSDNERAEIVRFMTLTPTVRKKIAGKSLPMEKFYSKKAQRFIAQKDWLFLPAVEVMYTWNYFIIAAKNRDIIMSLLALIERALADLSQTQKDSYYYMDNYCLGLFLKGVCLRCLNSPLLAEECFREVYQNYMNIRDDKHLGPWALYELGLMNMESGDYGEAEKYFKSAKNDYRKYSLESRLRFKIHASLSEIKLKTRSDACIRPSESSTELEFCESFREKLVSSTLNSSNDENRVSNSIVDHDSKSTAL